MEEADVIVVGAGPGGAAAAARLAEGGLSVLLLDAGGPAGWRGAAPGWRPRPLARGTWSWATDPQPGLGGRRLYHPAGRALGGSSAIGWSLYTPGEPEMFDSWAAAGLTGWDWAELAPHVRRIERDRLAAPPLRPSPATRALLAAAQAGGEPLVRDIAAPDARGAAPARLMLRHGERHHAARAWLAPAARRANLRVLPHALVERVLFERGRAWGVRYTLAGEIRTSRARAGVVLAAGAIATPLLLMRSGIGPTRELIEWGIPVVAPSPRVGRDLVEGISVPLAFAAAAPFGSLPRASVVAALNWRLRRRGAYADPPVTGALLLRAGASGSGLTAAILCSPRPEGRDAGSGPGFTLRLAVPQPYARGQVRLSGVAPGDRPRIDPNLLGDPRDLATLRWAHEAAMRLAAAPELGARPGHPVDPTALDAFLRSRAEGLHQPAGTAAMTGSDDGVTDPRLTVRGVDGLWLADLSALPAAPLGGVATAALVGERCADFLRATLR